MAEFGEISQNLVEFDGIWQNFKFHRIWVSRLKRGDEQTDGERGEVFPCVKDLAKTTEEGEEDEEEDEVQEEDELEDEDDIDAEEIILDVAEKAAIQGLTVREFQIPKINFKATSYPNHINWKQVIQGSHMVSGTRCPALLLFQDSGVRAGQQPQRADVL